MAGVKPTAGDYFAAGKEVNAFGAMCMRITK
jgi:hypothetical protein